MAPHGRERKHRPTAGADPVGGWELLQLLREGGARTRSQLAAELDLSRSTVTSRIQALTVAGLIRPVAGEQSGGGRPASTLTFNAAARLILAVHITAGKTRMALMDLGGEPHARHDAPLSPERDSPEHTLTAVISWARRTIARLNRAPEDLAAMGIAVPMDIDQTTGRPLADPVMPGWAGFDVEGFVSGFFPVYVKVESEIHCLALSEQLTRWADHKDLIYVQADGCPKAAIISGGQILRGFSGTAGTLPCPQDGDTNVPSSCASSGRTAWPVGGAPALVRDEGRRLGELLATAVTVLNPSAILIGGRNPLDGGHFIAGVRETVLHRSPPAATLGLIITLTDDNEDAVLDGIARLLSPEVLTAKTLVSLLCARSG